MMVKSSVGFVSMACLRIEQDCPIILHLPKILPWLNTYTLEIITVDMFSRYKNRIENVTEACKYVCAAIASQPFADKKNCLLLEKKVEVLKNYYLCWLKHNDLSRMQNLFLSYVRHLIHILSQHKTEDLLSVFPAQWLAKADKYSVFVKSHKPLITITKLVGVKEEQYLIQSKVSENRLSDAMLQQVINTQNADVHNHPHWYNSMQPYEKLLLKKAVQDVIQNPSDDILEKLRTIPFIPSLSKNFRHQIFLVNRRGIILQKWLLNSDSRLILFQESLLIYAFNYRKHNIPHNFFANMLDDKNFTKIFTSIYQSGHYQTQAGQLYIPQKIAKVIGYEKLVADNFMAENKKWKKLLSHQPLQKAKISLFSKLSVIIITIIIILIGNNVSLIAIPLLIIGSAYLYSIVEYKNENKLDKMDIQAHSLFRPENKTLSVLDNFQLEKKSPYGENMEITFFKVPH